MGELGRWTDDRLDDRFQAIDRTLQRLDAVSQAVANVPARLEEAIEDTHECRAGIVELNAQLAKRERQREAEKIAALELRQEEQKQALKDKKLDRRWLIGSLLTTGALVVAALGLLFGVIGIGA